MVKVHVLEITFDDSTAEASADAMREAIAQLLDAAGLTYAIEQRVEEVETEADDEAH